jgi:hypothetical protein
MAIGFAALVILWYEKLVNTRLAVVLGAILLVGIVLTYTRAAYIEMGVMLVMPWLMSAEFRKRVRIQFIVATGLVVLLLAFKVIKDSMLGRNSSIAAHLYSFQLIPELAIHPLGIGLAGAPEGLLFHLWWTSGIVGVAGFFLLVQYLYKEYRTANNIVAVALLISLLATSVISIELIGDTSCGAGWAILGGALTVPKLFRGRRQW